MASHCYQRSCVICGGVLKKNGKTSAGKTRYRCKNCGASSLANRAGTSRQAQIHQFISWLLSPGSRKDKSITQAKRRSMDWCWNVEVPQPVVTGEVYNTLMIDGTYMSGWCILVAFNGKHVLGWQWADKENKTAYIQLLSRFPPPNIVILDGHRGAFEAVKELWPHVLIQRCFFHIKARVRQLITSKPRTQCGIEINMLTKALMKITNPIQAATWLVQYHQWETRWEEFLKERTYAGKHQKSFYDTRKWWWTHKELRSVRGMYRAIIKTNTLFSYLEPLHNNPAAIPLSRTTSPLEGSINTGIKSVLRNHRGLSEEHARKAAEWYLNSKTEYPFNPSNLIKPKHYNLETSATPRKNNNPETPTEYDNAINPQTPWEDGIHIRKGWAGR